MLPTFVELGGGQVPDNLIVDGVSLVPLILGQKHDSPREWIMSLSFGSGTLDEQGVRPRRDFGPRVIRDKRYKVWVSSNRKIDRLHDLAEDPLEKVNLLGSKEPEHQQALARFMQIVDSLPEKDGRPLYEPRAPNPWDRQMAEH
jgi:hypothetical protein